MGEGPSLFRRQLPTSLFFLQPLVHFPALPQLSSIQFQKVRYQLDQPFEVNSKVLFVLHLFRCIEYLINKSLPPENSFITLLIITKSPRRGQTWGIMRQA
jgi:hypothetical protein